MFIISQKALTNIFVNAFYNGYEHRTNGEVKDGKGGLKLWMRKKILDEFRKLVDSKKQEIMEMQYMYLLKKAENEIVQEQFREVDNKILAEYPFYAYYDWSKSKKIHKGERILSSEDQWCMSTEDYDRFLEICRKDFFPPGLPMKKEDIEKKLIRKTN